MSSGEIRGGAVALGAAPGDPARLADRRRWARGACLGLVMGIALASWLAALASHGHVPYGFDFHGGIWTAARDIAAGRSPYRPPNARLLQALGNAYIPPPLLAEAALPLAALPAAVAIAAFNLVCLGSALLGLRLLGARDPQVFAFCICSAAFGVSLAYGDPDGIFLLLVAVAWRCRDSPGGAVAVGALIAAKLLLWPLVIWLLVTRRIRNAGLAAASAAGLLIAGWAAIGFHGFLSYPRFLAADSQVQAPNKSLTALLRALGLSGPVVTVLVVAIAVAVALMIVRAAQRSDHGWFTAAVLVGLLVSPVVWPNYYLVLLAPLAIARPRSDALWCATALLWLLLGYQTWEIGLQLMLVVLISARAVAPRLSTPKPRTPAADNPT